MDFSVCEMCRRPLPGDDLCPSCILKKQEIQRYADAHTEAGLVELSEEFGVSQKLLQKWVKKGYLKCVTKCRLCGSFIRSGELCINCKSSMANGFKQGNPDTKYAGRMHSKNRKG